MLYFVESKQTWQYFPLKHSSTYKMAEILLFGSEIQYSFEKSRHAINKLPMKKLISLIINIFLRVFSEEIVIIW